MASTRPKRKAVELGRVHSIRLPPGLVRLIERKRGQSDLSAFVRDTVAIALATTEEQAILDTIQYMERRGVTLDMLVRWKQQD